MLNLNRKTDYGLIALSCMALQPDRLISARMIAQMHGMRLPLLMKVLKVLSGSGIITSVRGSQGGYRLSRPAEQITLALLVEVLEGAPKELGCTCVNSHQGFECDLARHCPVHSPARKVHLKLLDFLEGITLSDLIVDEMSLCKFSQEVKA